VTATGLIPARRRLPVKTGDTVAVGGFGLVGAPLSLIDALADHSDATDLTVSRTASASPARASASCFGGRIRRGSVLLRRTPGRSPQ
jgi:acyl CoA:acetate/3-ketoacid CoA transferase alpha subunit